MANRWPHTRFETPGTTYRLGDLEKSEKPAGHTNYPLGQALRAAMV
jgi:hypothetical protein